MNIETTPLDGFSRKLAEVPQDATLNQTPAQQARAATASNTREDCPNVTVTGFEILSELGRGGMGVVYRARQIALNRAVALKMVLEGVRVQISERLRFLAEAEAVAAIKHPNVVQVYEFGECRGLPYFAMEFVEGGSLARALCHYGPMPPVETARLVSRVALGVQAAHDVGVVHRDLKPANILLSPEKGSPIPDQETVIAYQDTRDDFDFLNSDPDRLPWPTFSPKVTDFGIAKRGGGVDLTMTGMVMGTPAYMAPEQAIGKAKFVGPAADIYALGAIMFECLSGRTPFTAENSQALLLRVVQDDAPPVRSVAPGVPRDLELICSKCLAKNPHERYPSAAALAEDLDRFAAGEPVSVRPPGRLEKAVRWVRKYPTWAAVYGLTLVAAGLLVLVGGTFLLWQSAEKERLHAEKARQDAEDERGKTALALAGERQAREGEAKAQRTLAITSAARDTDFAYLEYGANNIDYARNLLALVPPNLRTWEWNFVARLARREAWMDTLANAQLCGLGFTDSGELIAAGSTGLWRWEANKKHPTRLFADPVKFLSVSGNGKRAAVCVTGSLEKTVILELPTGMPIQEIVRPVLGIVLDKSGTKLFQVLEKEIVLCDLNSGTERKSPVHMPTANQRPAVDPHGWQFAVGCLDDRDGRPNGKVALFDGDGRQLASEIRLSPKPVTAVCFCQDHPLLAAGSEGGELFVFDMKSGRPLFRPISTLSRSNALAFSPDGRWLASAGEDRVVRVWQLHGPEATEAFRFKGHSGPVTGISFSPNGTHLASVSLDGSVRYWNMDTIPDAIRLHTDGMLTAVAGLRGGERVIVSSSGTPCGSYDLKTGERLFSPLQAENKTNWLRLDPANSKVTLYSGDRIAQELPTELGSQAKKEDIWLPVNAVAASLDGKRLVSRGPDGSATVSDAAGRTISTTSPHTGEPHWTAISPDGKWVVTGGRDRVARVWDAETGKELYSLIGHNSAVKAAAVSPDRARIATASHDGVVKVWDGHSGRVRLTLPSLNEAIASLSWTLDGKKLIAGNARGELQIFDGSPVSEK